VRSLSQPAGRPAGSAARSLCASSSSWRVMPGSAGTASSPGREGGGGRGHRGAEVSHARAADSAMMKAARRVA
jgi:hypothetical protein